MKYNLDGVQIDIENVTEVDRDNYTDLVRLLREKLPKEKKKYPSPLQQILMDGQKVGMAPMITRA
ncbi:hypothetical protein GCM10020331_011600 [Ectobacillus funiculus]